MPFSPAACRKAAFMVRNRPSRSTSARPIGSTSSSACRLDDNGDRAALEPRRTARKCRRPPRRQDQPEHGPREPAGADLAFREQTHLLVVADLDEVGEAASRYRLFGADRPLGKQTVRGKNETLGIDHRRQTLRRCEALADSALHSPYGARQWIGRRRVRKAPQQQIVARTDTLDLDRAGSGAGLDPGTQPAPSRHAIDWASCKPSRAPSPAATSRGGSLPKRSR